MTAQTHTSLIKITGALIVLLYAVLMVESRGYADVALPLAALVYGAAMMLVTLLAIRLSRYPRCVSDSSRMLIWLLAFAVLFRLIGVFTHPILEDDFYRYLWDGRMVVETGFPYGVAPAEWFDRQDLDATFVEILDGINYPWVATVYGPTLQLWYALGYVVAPGAVWPLQLIAAVADLGVILLLFKLCADRTDLFLGGGVLYAWSPLLIKEFATTAHPDVVGVFFVVLALVFYCRSRWFWLGLCLGLATGVKPFALVIAPFLIGLRWRAMLGFACAIAVLTVPFLLAHQAPDVPAALLAIWLPEGLRTMGDDWLFNAPVYLLAIQWETGLRTLGLVMTASGVKAALLGGFALLWSWQLVRWLRGESRWVERQQGGAKISLTARRERLGELPHAWLFGVFLLVLPALNPWYLVWWLPFAVLKTRGTQWITPWAASYAVGLSYVTGINLTTEPGGGSGLGLYEIPGAVATLEFALIACAVIWDFWRSYRGSRSAQESFPLA